MAHSFSTFTSPAAVAGRVVRRARFVTIVEGCALGWAEFDADSAHHACVLAKHWLRREVGAVSASCWRVLADGTLLDVPFAVGRAPMGEEAEPVLGHTWAETSAYAAERAA